MATKSRTAAERVPKPEVTPLYEPDDSGADGVGPLPERRLRRQSLGNQIAEQLRQDILVGRLAPGTHVGQQNLCDVYGTSRMPVRDAVRQRVSEGLVTYTSGGHSIVAAQ